MKREEIIMKLSGVIMIVTGIAVLIVVNILNAFDIYYIRLIVGVCMMFIYFGIFLLFFPEPCTILSREEILK